MDFWEFEDDFPSQLQEDNQTQLQEVEKAGFRQLRDWEAGRAYDERPAKYIHYSIDWSSEIHGRMQSKNTELALVLVPASYGRLFRKPMLEQACLNKMRTKKKPVESEDTKVIIIRTT